MFSVAQMPVWNNSGPWDQHKPVNSSPLQISSPIRGPSPLSPIHGNSSQRSCFSSPPAPTSKFASRPAKPNPLFRRREEGQETRRNLFMKNVRNRAEDKAFERRSIEGHAVRRWYYEHQQLNQQKELDTAALLSEADIEDAAAAADAAMNMDMEGSQQMAEEVARQEQLELEALLASYEAEAEASSSSALALEENTNPPQQRPASPHYSDDDEYDEILMELMSNEAQNGDEMDTS